MLKKRDRNPVGLRFAGLAAIAVASVVATAGSAVASETADIAVAMSRENPPPAPKLLQSYDLSWWSVDGGGGSSSGGAFAVTGSLGQTDAGSATGCGTALAGGVWSGPDPVELPMFCDGFEGGDTGAWSSVTP